MVFGKHIPWQKTMQHIERAYEDGIVDKKFRKMRFQGFITERVNRKNTRVNYPRIFKYIPNGTHEGCFDYLRWWT
jgi:hypothetical protein